MTRADVPMTHAQERELKAKFECAIAHVPGKSEADLLRAIEKDARLRLA